MKDKLKVSADEIIDRLNLQPHPEGGYFKEVYRSQDTIFSNNANSDRSALTDIYFLLKKGEVSRFHKVLHDEIWNFYLGDPLKLIEYSNNKMREIILGKENLNFKYTIKANNWQAAESLGNFTLVGCTVAPGFHFDDFSFIEDDTTKIEILNNFNTFRKFI